MTTRTKPRLQEIEEILKEQKPFLEREFKVKTLGIFGSFVRGEQKRTSDVDILVEFSQPVGLIHFVRLKDSLTDLLGIKVDLVMKSALKPALRDRILAETRHL